MSTQRARYNMFPQRTYAGYVETELLESGHIKYYIFLDGCETSSEMIIDPRNENDVRSVKQLHMIAAGSGQAYAIEGQMIPGVVATVDPASRNVQLHRQTRH